MAVTVYKVVRIVDGKYVSCTIVGAYQVVYEPGSVVRARFPVFVFGELDSAERYREIVGGADMAILECRADSARPVHLVALVDGSRDDAMAIESYWYGGKVFLSPAPWGSFVADQVEVIRRVA